MGKIKTLTFIDVETTAKFGPVTRADAIVEIAAARVDLTSRQITDEFTTLIRPWGDQIIGTEDGDTDPRWDLGTWHLERGTFTGADWSQALDYPLALEMLADRFLNEGATIAGQNPGFDLDHLKRDWSAFGWEWPKLDYHVIDLCSPALFLVMGGKAESLSLRNVIPWAYADPSRKQAHRAGGDVRDAIQVFFAMFDYFMHGAAPVRNAQAVHEPRLCTCPATSEFDPPCPRHGVLGIGVTGR